MEYGLSDNDINDIKEIFTHFPQVEQTIIFGSRVLGTYREGSDIDIAVIGKDVKFDDILALSIRLEELELLNRFDIQNYNSIKDEAVIDHIKRVGKVFYSR